MKKVLIIEDEKELAEILVDYLTVEGFEAVSAFDGEEGFAKFTSFRPDIVLLDIMLPKINGIEICKKIRNNSDALIIMLSAKNGEMDKVVCLGAGADDYMTKPFSPLELVARVKAHIRRFSSSSSTDTYNSTDLFPISLNKASYQATICGDRVELTTKEFELLFYFITNQNIVLSKEQLYSSIWGECEYGDIGVVAVYIKRLRDKLLQYNLDYIKTVWGAGYKFYVDTKVSK